jgi:3-oxoadipate enol-lactonase
LKTNVNGATIHYLRSGHGHPLLLIHAGIADSRMWEPQVAAFSTSFDVVRPDLRGFGESELPPRPYSMRQDLIGLMDQLGLERFCLAGCSMGGSLAADIALEYPDRVEKLVLVAAGVGGANLAQADRALFADVEAADAEHDLEALNRAEVRLWVDGPRRPEGSTAVEVRELVLEMNRRALASDFGAAPHQDLEPPAVGRLEEIRCPTLVIVGDQDLPHATVAADLLASRIPHARKVVFHDTAHLPSLERPEEFNRVVLDFLRS